MDVQSEGGRRELPKHARYRPTYKPFDYFWGLGLEHETYLLTSQVQTGITSFDGRMKPERYSVNYYAVYDPDALKSALQRYTNLSIPVIMNSHSWTHADVHGEHKTTYEKNPKPNPRYAGQTLYEWASSKSEWLRTEIDKTFMWDGDTVEFMTQQFYNATVPDVMRELRLAHEGFCKALQDLPREGIFATYGPLSLAYPKNEPWAFHMTNLQNIAMFNNGTLHVNVTLPTRLDWNCRPFRWQSFVRRHQTLARYIQWLEPLWVAMYGSGDPLSEVSDRFAAGSQRLAVSRYIGVGTYDTETMRRGKILQVPKEGLGPLPWYDRLYAKTAYRPMEMIGLDLNFNKHWAHGLEIRLFDQMPYDQIKQVLRHIVQLMDLVDSGHSVPNPCRDVIWQDMAFCALYEGPGWRITPEQVNHLASIFGIPPFKKEPLHAPEVMGWLMHALEGSRGWCWERMVGPVL